MRCWRGLRGRDSSERTEEERLWVEAELGERKAMCHSAERELSPLLPVVIIVSPYSLFRAALSRMEADNILQLY